MFDRSQHQSHDRAGDREPMISARQAAEALFAPKRQLSEQPAREAGPPSGEPVRKPRVLSVSPPAEHPRQEPLAATPKIPKSQFARIRAWQRYGMSARQVAEVYGVSVGEIESILRAT